MKYIRLLRQPRAVGLLLTVACLTAACASGTSAPATNPLPAINTTQSASAAAPSPDPRVGLRDGTMAPWPKDTTKRIFVTPAAEAAWNMRLISNTLPKEPFIGVTHSDIAFTGNYAIQGNYDGYQVWDISNPRAPKLYDEYVCRGSQSDVSIYKNLVFVSGEATSGRVDCGLQGVPDSVSKERFRGIRIFDVSNMKKPKYLANVQTCRGSHTHTVVEDPNDKQNVYVYISGSSGVRSPNELPGCSQLAPGQDANSSLFRIEVIQVPLAAPATAKVVSYARFLDNLAAVTAHAPPSADVAAGRGGRGVPPAGGRGAVPAGGRGGAPGGAPAVRTGPNQCHDITVYPAIGLAGGACGGYGVLLDIRDVKNPRRVQAVSDSNMSFWHSATFNNAGTKVLFSDEWGGGRGARCRATDKMEWGGDALFTLQNNEMVFKSYFKMPAAQTTYENCVAHNGSLIPIPGRDVMVQAWYQGGVSIMDWTDIEHPKEIAFHDRGATEKPANEGTVSAGGSWSVYWYNGFMYSSEIARGLDVFELLPSANISQNEIDAAKTVRYEYLNVQGQQKMVWPASFALARAYADQLNRSSGLASGRTTAIMTELAAAEKMSGAGRTSALTALATKIDADAASATDAAKTRMLASAVRDLAK